MNCCCGNGKISLNSFLWNLFLLYLLFQLAKIVF